MTITRVINGACESISPAMVELYCVESSSTPSLGLLNSSEFLRSHKLGVVNGRIFSISDLSDVEDIML